MESFGERLLAHYKAHIETVKASRYHGRFEGLTDDEIERIRMAQQVDVLPDGFVQFLRVMGREAGGIFSEFKDKGALEVMLRLKSFFLKAIVDYKLEPGALPAQIVVFFPVGGDDFIFFEATSAESDPPVYCTVDECRRIFQVSETLTSWFFEQALYPSEVLEWFADDCPEVDIPDSSDD